MEAAQWREFMARQDMVWEELPMAWDEGPFLGDGMLGAMVFLQKGRVRLEVCRADVTDHRSGPMPVSFAYGRLPIGYFELALRGEITGGELRLNLYDAQLEAVFRTTRGEARLWAAAYRGAECVGVRVNCGPGEAATFRFVPAEAFNPRQRWGLDRGETNRVCPDYLPNPQPALRRVGQSKLCVQPLLEGWSTVTAWREEQGTLLFTCAHAPGQQAEAQALAHLDRAAAAGVQALQAAHRAWWHAYYQRSFLSLSDARYENFYWIQLYKQASAMRPDGVVLDNQGPWLWETAWPYTTWNLNVQLSYWLCCGSNHVDLGLSLLRTLTRRRDNLAAGLPEAYRENCLAMDTVASPECRYQISAESIARGTADIGDLTWALHDCWRMYRYTMDPALLRELYPLLKGAVAFMERFLEDRQGAWHFRPTASPEYRWGCPEDCNYTLSIFRFGVEALLEGSRLLDCDQALRPRWQDYLDRLAPWPEDGEQGFLIGKDLPYAHSHRHYSHLLMIYPFHQVNVDQPGDKARALRSLKHWQSMPEELRGYSCTGGASIAAALGEGDLALDYLQGLWEHFLRPNTLYKESGPVIETPLSGAQSMLDMLVQSWGGKIRFFPARPEAWPEVCFHDLLCEGGYLASGCCRQGRIVYAAVRATRPGLCRALVDGREYTAELAAGETWTLLGQEVWAPMPQAPGTANCYGLNPRQRRIFGAPLKSYELH